MAQFLKLNFVKENFIYLKGEWVSDGYEHVETYFNANLITHFVECEDIPGDGTSMNYYDFSECFESGLLLNLSEEGAKAVDNICDRVFDEEITSDATAAKGAPFVMVANSADYIMQQLNQRA